MVVIFIQGEGEFLIPHRRAPTVEVCLGLAAVLTGPHEAEWILFPNPLHVLQVFCMFHRDFQCSFAHRNDTHPTFIPLTQT